MNRIALIIPNTDTTLEADLQRSLRGNQSVHTQRVWLGRVTVEDEDAMLRDEVPRAVEYLRPIQPDTVVFGCTSAGALRGVNGEIDFCHWLETELGCPIVSAFGSVRRKLLDAGQAAPVWLITPYARRVHETMLDSLAEGGITVRDGGCMGVDDDVAVGRLTPEEIAKFVRGCVRHPAPEDRIFISCTNLRAHECAPGLARDLGCRVTSSNTAILESLNKLLH